tara:strand:+ start:842 stop:1159 length:318 start_codon:yes stop_codon:yes gene_type:complete
MGTIESSTAWLNGIAGVSAGDAAEGVKIMIVDLVITSASSATTFDLTDTGITGVVGTTAHAVLGLHNNSGGFEIPADIRTSGATVLFTSPSGTNTDTMRLTLLYS